MFLLAKENIVTTDLRNLTYAKERYVREFETRSTGELVL